MADLMDLPPIGYYPDRKWASFEDFRTGKRIAMWRPRPEYRAPVTPPDWNPLLKTQPEEVRRVLRDIEEMRVEVRGRVELQLLSATGDLALRAVSDNIVTEYGKMAILNAMRSAVGGFIISGTSNSSLGYFSVTNSVIVQGPTTALIVSGTSSSTRTPTVAALGVFLTALDGSRPAAGANASYLHPWYQFFLSDTATAESVTENAVPARTYVSPTREKDAISTTDRTKLHPDSGINGAGAVYMRWDFGASEANNTWYSAHFARGTPVGADQGMRALLAVPVEKTSDFTMPASYTLALSVA